MKMIFEKLTNKNKWTVYTPHKSFRNHHFYESLGFKKYGEAILSDKLTLFKYVKYNQLISGSVAKLKNKRLTPCLKESVVLC